MLRLDLHVRVRATILFCVSPPLPNPLGMVKEHHLRNKKSRQAGNAKICFHQIKKEENGFPSALRGLASENSGKRNRQTWSFTPRPPSVCVCVALRKLRFSSIDCSFFLRIALFLQSVKEALKIAVNALPVGFCRQNPDFRIFTNRLHNHFPGLHKEPLDGRGGRDNEHLSR